MLNSKVRILPMALISALALSACISPGPPKPAEVYPTKFDTPAVAKLLPAGPVINVGDVFEDDNLDDTFGATNKVVIPGFRVVFVLTNEASASVAGGSTLGGGYSSGAKARLAVTLAGVTREMMQQITDAAYADLVAQLKAAGREVISVEQMRTTLGYRAIDFFDSAEPRPRYIEPSVMKGDTRSMAAMAPTGLPLWFMPGDRYGDKSPFDQQNNKAVSYLSHELNAVALVPTVVLDFANVTSSGRSMNLLGGGSAEVGAKPDLHTSEAVLNLYIGDQNGLAKAWGSMRIDTKESISMGADFGTFRELTSDESSGSVIPLGSFMYSDAASSKSSHAMVVEPVRFTQQSLMVLQSVNAAYTQMANRNKP